MYTLIVNPTAGNGRALKVCQQVTQALNARGLPFQTLETLSPGHATQLARKVAEQKPRAVLCIGGDGTAFEVAAGLMDSGIPMGLIPAGTGNDLIKSLKTPKDPMAALEFILNHQPRHVDTGRFNDQIFLNECGAGFDVLTLDFSLRAKRYVKGIFPYLYGLIRAIFAYRPIPVEMHLDDGTLIKQDILVCAIANGGVIGGGIIIAPEATVDDHLFDIVVLDAVPRRRLFRYLPGLLKGSILKFDITHHYRCRKCTLRSKGMRLNADGEIFTLDEARFECCEDRLLFYW